MTQNKPIQRFSPVLRYNDADKAIAFLTEAFGFKEHVVHRSPEGVIVHAELESRGGYIDLGPCVIYAVIDDIDAHHDHAVAAGAEIVYPLTDQDYGSRDYGARDPEGFVWAFGTYWPGNDPTAS